MTPTESGGLFSGTGSGDAQMARDILDVNGAEARMVRIGMSLGATNTPTNAQFFWRNEDGNFGGGRSKAFNVIADGTQRIYEIDMTGDLNWDGTTIDRFRFDPVSNNGDSFQIDFIEFVSIAPIPEPSSLILSGLGMLFLLRRRR
jgi:hypothetical protein